MQICCTKKLQERLDFKFEAGTEEEDIFCWSANLITVNRRKAVVVVNDCSRFGFILYGLKIKDFKNIDNLIREGIKNILSEERIKDEVIEKYFEDAGEFMFSKTRGAKYVAKLNKACERTMWFTDVLYPEIIFQQLASDYLNDDFIRPQKGSDYELTYNILYTKLREHYGEDIIKTEAVKLMIKLNLNKYTAWRRIITPINISYNQLHNIIQTAFDWKNYHLYDFSILSKSGIAIKKSIDKIEEYEDEYKYELNRKEKMAILDYYKNENEIIYTYDYGDNWVHNIKILNYIEDYDKNYPICLMGGGDAPPEDVGGVHGYEEFLNVLDNPDHEEYKHTKRWAESQWYKPFDLRLVNISLKNILRK